VDNPFLFSLSTIVGSFCELWQTNALALLKNPIVESPLFPPLIIFKQSRTSLKI
jgi:hypothetical protein